MWKNIIVIMFEREITSEYWVGRSVGNTDSAGSIGMQFFHAFLSLLPSLSQASILNIYIYIYIQRAQIHASKYLFILMILNLN
jgi:hypothetical protein